MKISLIIPIYNESKTVEAMLRQLDALPGDWEILFTDGGSTDDTLAKIGKKYIALYGEIAVPTLEKILAK